jgi:hypothetical protein
MRLNRTTSVDYLSSRVPGAGPTTDGTYRTYETYEQIDAAAAFVIAARGTHADTPIPHAPTRFLRHPRISVPISADTKLGRLISGNSGTVKVRS